MARVAESNMANLNKTVAILDQLATRKEADPKGKSDALYYRVLSGHLRALASAKEEGRKIVSYTVGCPAELIYAMGMVPMSLEWTSMTMSSVLGLHHELFEAASSYGFKSEICGLHRKVNGAVLNGWLPRPDADLWASISCDNTVKSGDFIEDFHKVPGFFLDRTLLNTGGDFAYFQHQFEDMLEFLEKVAGHKVDKAIFGEVMERSHRSAQLLRQINELRKATPYPAPGRLNSYLGSMFNFSGSVELLAFYQQMLSEMQENVRLGIGCIPNERHRLMTISYSPTYSNKVLDWMEKTFGAVSVTPDPIVPHCDAAFELDPQKPLESLARKSFFSNPISTGALSLHESDFIPRALRLAREYRVDGVIFWAHCVCRSANAWIRPLKDAVTSDLEIPMAVVDLDFFDPTYKSDDQLKDELEGFFEILDAR